MSALLAYALARLRLRRGRTLLVALGIAAASAMLGAALTVALSLGAGFDRAAAASNLPDAIVRFRPVDGAAVASRISALPNLRAAAYRLEATGQTVVGGGHGNFDATVEGVGPGPRGYALVEGRDVRSAGEVVVERGLARAWHLRPGSPLRVNWRWFRVAGVAVSPETVAYPLVNQPRVYLLRDEAATVVGGDPSQVDEALLWARDRSLLDVTLAQARAASYGLSDLRLLTRSGIRVVIGQAAGLVIALLVAFSLVALAAAGAMLSAASAAEVQRRLEAIGLARTLGASRLEVVAAHALEGALVALPAGALGVAAGWLAVRGPTDRLLVSLNELPPGGTLPLLLALAVLAVAALVAASAAIPAWRAARRRPVEALRRSDVVGAPRRAPLPGAAGLGVRLVLARPLRSATAVAVLTVSAAFVLLVLAIASLLQGLQRDPHVLGRRYALQVQAPAARLDAIRRLPGVAAAAPRWEVPAADSFDLGESFDLVAFGGDHTAYEAPPLEQGRRLRGPREAEVGVGLADALGLRPGAVLAAQLPDGREARYRVVGVVGALQRQGRIAWVGGGLPGAPEIAVKLRAGADSDRVRGELSRLRGVGFAESAAGVAGDAVRGWATRNNGFVDVLVALLRAVAVIDALVCLYALAQVLALTAEERRGAVAVVRACGGSPRQVLSLFAGSALTLALLAAPLGLLVERFVVGPRVASLAASYASLSLGAGATASALVAAGLVAAALLAAAVVARSAVREPVVAGLQR